MWLIKFPRLLRFLWLELSLWSPLAKPLIEFAFGGWSVTRFSCGHVPFIPANYSLLFQPSELNVRMIWLNRHFSPLWNIPNVSTADLYGVPIPVQSVCFHSGVRWPPLLRDVRDHRWRPVCDYWSGSSVCDDTSSMWVCLLGSDSNVTAWYLSFKATVQHRNFGGPFCVVKKRTDILKMHSAAIYRNPCAAWEAELRDKKSPVLVGCSVSCRLSPHTDARTLTDDTAASFFRTNSFTHDHPVCLNSNNTHLVVYFREPVGYNWKAVTSGRHNKNRKVPKMRKDTKWFQCCGWEQAVEQ